MPTVASPLSSIALDLASLVASGTPAPSEAHVLLGQIDRSGLVTTGCRILPAEDGTLIQVLLPTPPADLVLAVPGLPKLAIVLGLGQAAGEATIDVLLTDTLPPVLDVRNVRLGLRFDPSLLRPLDGTAQAQLMLTGGIRFSEWTVRPREDASLSLAPCEIGRTGIVIELRDVQVDLSTTWASPGIRALGLADDFRGVYFAAGSLRILPQAVFGSFPGVALEITDAALGTGGVTCTVRRSFALTLAAGQIEPSSEMVGSLFGGALQLALTDVEVSLRENALQRFAAIGAARLPILEVLLEARFSLQPLGDGSFQTTLGVRSLAPLDVAVGPGRIRAVTLALDGVLAPDSLTLRGSLTGFEVTLAPLAVTVAAAEVEIAHGPTGDELRIALRQLPLGPLGMLDEVALVVDERRDGATVTRHVQLEGSIAWNDLRGRLALPSGLPAPAGGQARAVLVWEDNGAGGQRVVVRISATFDDPSSLWNFVPAAYRPQIEEASLQVEVVYPDAAAFGAASASGPLSGSVAVSVVARLPVLPTLPGVLTVHTGDASGRVRGTLRTTVDAGGTPQVALALTDPVSLDLALPGFSPGGAPVVHLGLASVDVANGDRPGRGTFALAGSVSAAGMESYLTRLVTQLGLPSELGALLQRLGQAMPDEGSFSLAVQLDGATAVPSIELAFRSSNPPKFRLLEELGKLVNPGQASASGATPLPGLGPPHEFFEVSPGELRVSATLADRPTIRLSGSLDTMVLGETFDMTIAIGIEPDDFEIALTAGAIDPILITAPVPDPSALLGAASVPAIAAAYGLDSGQRQALTQLEQVFTDLAAELGAQGVFAFEISDFGLRLTPAGPAVSGQARLVQLPRFVEVFAPLTELRLGLGAETDKLFITIERAGGDAEGPLLTVPVPGNVDLAIYFRHFMLAYAWGRNEFAFALDAGIVPSRTLDMTVGGSGVLLPAVTTDVQLGATATAPPVPIPEGILSFERPQRRPSDRAVDELGLQAVIGAGRTRFVTAYLRELAFSPTYFLLWPGFRGDGGLVLGGPNPMDRPTADAYLNVRDWDRGAFFARFTVKRGSLIFFDSMLGIMLNPLAAVPPFVTANPPYWIAPPTIMGDLYADEIGVSVNIPGLVFFDLTFERPLPSFSLQALLELAALVAGGFAHAIPPQSPLRKVFYARLSAFLDVRLLGLSPAGTSVSATVEANVADLINGAIDVMHKATATLDAGSDLVQDVARDPGGLVRMIPREARRLQHTLKLGGFDFSGSLYLLAPDELHAELMLFFENKRRRARGIAANQTPPAPPTATPVNRPPVWTERVPITRQDVPDARSLAPDLGRVGARSVAAALAGQQARAGKLEGLKRNRGRNVDDAAGAIAGALAKISLGDARARRNALDGFGLAEIVGPVEAAVSILARRGGRIDAPTIAATLRAVVAEAMTSHDDAMIADSALSAPPEEIAATLVERIVARPSPGRRSPGAPAPVVRPTILPVRDRTPEIERLVPIGRTVGARRAVGDAVGRLEQQLTAPGVTAATGERAIADAKREIASALVEQFGVRHQKVGTLDSRHADPATLMTSIRTGALATWRTPPRLASRTIDVGIFNGTHFAGVLRGVDIFAPRAPDPSDTVETVVGYQIQRRDGGGIAVPVPSAGAMYKVALEGGRYRLRVRRKDRTWSAHDLPAAMVASVPDGPEKIDRLRDQLVIAPRTTRRPRTQAEKDAVRERFEQSNTLYMTSILARPEYQVKPSGGVHGPFYLADLLRDPSTGAYTVPTGPALLGGFKATLFGSELRLAGLVVGGQSGPSAFLYGHSVVNATVGALKLKAEGEFVASAGSLWHTVPLPSGVVAAQNAVGFSGHVVVMHGNHKTFEGSASGEFTRAANGSMAATLNVHVTSQGSADLEVGDAKFARVAWSFDGDLEVRLSSQTVTISAGATVTVSADLATYATRWVVDIPAETVCVPWYYVDSLVPPSGHWGSACTTTPEVSHPEIDFSSVNWERLASASCALRASVSNTGVSFELDLGALGSAVTNTIGATKLALSNLL